MFDVLTDNYMYNMELGFIVKNDDQYSLFSVWSVECESL